MDKKKKSMSSRLLGAIGNAVASLFNVGIPLKVVLVLLIVLVGAAIGVTYSRVIRAVGGKADYDEAMRYIEIKDVIEENFIDEVSRDSMGDSAAAAMVNGLGDKWSSFMSAGEYRTYQLNASNEYSEIGMAILKTESGAFQVMSVAAGTPAANAGLGAGMLITSVDGSDVTKLDADDVRTMIRSRMNTKFTLGLSNKDTLTIDCTKTYVSPVTYRLEKTRAGYVKLASFEAGSGSDAIKAIEDLLNQGCISLVIDLRGNPGGLTGELQTFMDYLLPNVRLFSTVNKQGKTENFDSDSICIQMPICVLVNANTYAEAEVCAATLQEYNWAVVIGVPTTGKTRTQETIELSDGSAIRLSTKSYLTPNGIDLSATGGVVPDTIVYNPEGADENQGTTGESSGTGVEISDEQLLTALRTLSLSSVG